MVKFERDEAESEKVGEEGAEGAREDERRSSKGEKRERRQEETGRERAIKRERQVNF